MISITLTQAEMAADALHLQMKSLNRQYGATHDPDDRSTVHEALNAVYVANKQFDAKIKAERDAMKTQQSSNGAFMANDPKNIGYKSKVSKIFSEIKDLSPEENADLRQMFVDFVHSKGVNIVGVVVEDLGGNGGLIPPDGC